MAKLWQKLKDNFWPISALIFCPCHLPLTMGAFASLTAGTAMGAWISTHYSSIETVLAVTFSFYFVLAFMIWVVRGPKQREGAVCVIDARGNKRPSGMSTRQIVTWGAIGMFTTPALVSISFFTRQSNRTIGALSSVVRNFDYNSGFIWLVSIAVVVMIPVMVIWLVWLWQAWVKTDRSQPGLDDWGYEYE